MKLIGSWERKAMFRTTVVNGVVAAAALGLAAASAQAQSTVKIGALLPMTGQQQSTGVQIAAAIRLYMAQELIVNDKVNFLVGFGVTPAALAVAPLSTEAKIPQIVMAAGTSIITERSPYIARTSFTLPQSTVIMADWALKNGVKKVVSMVSDFAPGIDAEGSFKETFTKGGGQILESIRVPLANPDAVFIFVPPGQGGTFVKQFIERGLDKAGIKTIGPGDVTDDDLLNGMGDQVIGTVTAHMYS